MKNRPWLDAFRVELVRQGLPKRHVARLMEELSDHALDLMEEMKMDHDQSVNTTIENRLGQPAEVAEAAVANYRTARFVGRHPWLTFLVAPLPVVVLAWIVFLLVGLGLFKGLPYLLGDAYQIEGKTVDQWPPTLLSVTWGLDYLARFLPSALVAATFCYLVRRSGRSIRWALLACGLVAVFSSGLQTSLQFPEAAGGTGCYTVGFGLALDAHLPELIYLFQFAVPMTIGLVFAAVYHGRWRELQAR